MFGSDLAELYQVTTGNLNLAVRRNAARFPEDFMFQITREEFENLRLQFATSSSGYSGRRYLPYAFSEHGVATLSSVLNSERAVWMNILIIRAFVKLRELLAANKELARKIEQIEAAQQQQVRTQLQIAMSGALCARGVGTSADAARMSACATYQKYSTSGRTCPLASRHGPHCTW
jgi:hypothetical protein